MIHKLSRISYITLVFLTLLLSLTLGVQTKVLSEQHPADAGANKLTIPDGSVLNLIPQNTLGLIYCPSLTALDNRISMLIEDLMPQSGQGNLLATILAGSFGAGFENLDELEDIGLDLNKDFAVFFTGGDQFYVTATVHITDPVAIKDVIETEAQGSEPIEYDGVTYWSSPEGEGNFLILNDILIYSQHTDVCENVIDTHNGKSAAIVQNADTDMFRPDILNGNDQLGIYFDFEAILDEFTGSFEEMMNTLTEDLAMENDPVTAEIMPTLETAISNIGDLLDQSQFLSATLHIMETDIQLKPFLKLKKDSEILKEINKTSGELTNIGELPNVSMMNGAFQGVPKMLLAFSTFWIDILPKDPVGQPKEMNPLFQEVQSYYESLADRWSMSVDFNNSIVPNYLFIYDLKDEKTAKSYMNGELLKKLNAHHNVHAGESIMHNGIEIRSYVFPNFEPSNQNQAPAGSGLIPEEWHWHYAFADGHLYFTTGTSDESIKAALDSKTDEGDKFAGNPSYQRLVEGLGTDNNVFLAISPIVAIKNFMPIVGKMDPNSAAAIQMFAGLFMTLPDNYSIGISAKTHNDGIDTKLLLTLGDFRQLIQMFGMVMGAGQMQ